MFSLKPKPTLQPFHTAMLTQALGFLMLVYIFGPGRFSKLEWLIVFGGMVTWLVIVYWSKLYRTVTSEAFGQMVARHVRHYAGYVLLLLLCYLFLPEQGLSKKRLILFAVGVPLAGFLFNLLLLQAVSWISYSKTHVRTTLVAGTGHMAKKVERQLYGRKVSGYRILGYVNCLQNEECLVGRENVVSNLRDIKQYLEEHPVDEIVIALPGKPLRKIRNIMDAADYYGIRVKYIPDYDELFGRNYQITRYGAISAVDARKYPIDGSIHSLVKLVFDKVFSIFTLVFLAPIFLVLGILIKLDSPGPIFYRPIRIGKSGKPILVYKFRSMRIESDGAGSLSTSKNDPRVTKIGRFMRKYSIDELPQFINVLLGNMSVVGPRPHRRFLDKQLQECVGRYMIRHYVKPGITGWAQVNGWRGPTDTDEQKRQRTLHDLWYLENWSIWLDIKIVLLTVFSKKAHKSAF